MGQSIYDNESVSSNKKSGCKHWVVAIACSVIIAVGLAIGLGVGLSNQVKDSDSEPITSDPVTSQSPPITSQPVPEGPGPWENYRLPDYIVPGHYRLKLHPNMSTDTFTGSNAMTISLRESTKYIVVHADAYLIITSTNLEQMNDDGSSTSIKIIYEFREPTHEYYVMQTDKKLEAGNEYLLTMEFEGSLIGKVVGLYKAVYTIPNTGEVKAMVGSDMEPTDARKAYPCFDEPAMKFRYTTTLVHEPIHVALSNMDQASNMTRPDGLIETTFRESVPMSSYTSCFAIGEFVCFEKISEKNKIPLRIYVPPHQKEAKTAEYAMDIMKIQFDYFEELFQVNYSLPKLDMISIPDFGTGAMENWGLITFRETNLLWDREKSSTYNKQRVAAVVSHELVHQWFSNLVTMKWWDNIWLNEGFASYLEYFALNASEPSWNVMDLVVTDDLQRVFLSDDSVTSRTIISNVSTPSQITSVLDTISYSKGASLLRYMKTVLGHDVFFKGLTNYLNKRQFSNADEQDFFSDMQEYADSVNLDASVTELMNPWVHQMGFPVLTVNSNTGTVTQDHFLVDPNADRSSRPISSYDYKWNIELTHITSYNDTVQKTFFQLESDSVILELETLESNDWLKLNPSETGYYRVNYDDAMWSTLNNQLMTNHTVFAELDRSNLIDDAFNLAPAGLISYDQALNMTQYLDKERSFLVWTAFSRGSSYIQEMLKSSSIYPMYQEYYVQKVKPTADSLGWNATEGSHLEKRNRVLVLSLALEYGDDEALNQAGEYFRKWIENPEYYLYPDTRQLVYTYGAKDASESEWEEMLRRYLNENVASEKSNLLRGINSVENVDWIDKMLDNCWNESVVRSQDFFSCITYISYTVMGNRMAWTWIQQNWERMVERYGLTDRNLGNLVPNIVSNYNTEIQLWEVESFFEDYPEEGAGESARVSAVNSIKTNIQWMNQNQDSISTWLQNHL